MFVSLSHRLFQHRGTAVSHPHLRNDLAEDGDDHSRQDETDQAGREICHDDRQQRVHRHVPEQQRAQQQIAVRPYRLYFLSQSYVRARAYVWAPCRGSGMWDTAR